MRRSFSAVAVWLLVGASAVAAGPLAEGKFVTVKDGHLWYDGQRLRLWGTNFVCDVKRQGKDLELTFERMADAGINGVRLNLFDGTFLEGVEGRTYPIVPVVKDSGSAMDRLDHAIALAKQHGMFFWISLSTYRHPTEADYDAMPDDGTREEWNQLIKEDVFGHIVYYDRRAERVFEEYARSLIEHVNPYTGKRWADEEAIGLYEVFNENGFVEQVLRTTPTGIKKKRLTQRWNEWLKERYATQEALVAAWGNLNEGESLADGTVEFAPTLAGVQVEKAGYQKEFVVKEGDLGSYPYARGEDVVRFAVELYTGHTARFIAFLRSLAPEGVGINVVPVTPTGRFGNSLQNYWAATCGDFASYGIYGFGMRPWEVKPDDPYYPYVVRVNGHPLMEQPIDLVRVPNKPHLIYECNDSRPNPYATEFYARMAAFASWQDYDGVFWFYWDDRGYQPTLTSDQDYLNVRMPIPDTSYPNAGLIMANDEAVLAASKAAGALFRSGALPAACEPVTATFGRDILLNLAHRGLGPLEDTGGMDLALRQHVWRRGLRTVFDPEADTVLPEASYGDEPRIAMGPVAQFDWSDRRGFIRVDSPSAKMYTGFLKPSLVFDGGVEVRGIDRQFGMIALVAQDGLPLERSRSILVAAISRSRNTGMEITPEALSTKDLWQQGLAQMCGRPGDAPAVVDRIDCEIRAPWLAGMNYEKRSFIRETFESGKLGSGKLVLRGYEPTFYARLTRPATRAVKKLLIAGNSITRHPPADHLGWQGNWGMAATAPEKDFAHRLHAYLCEAQSDPKPELIIENLFEGDGLAGKENLFAAFASYQADLVLIQVGDNTSLDIANEETLTKPYAKLLAMLKEANPDALVCGVSMWGACPQRNALMKAACDAQGAPWLYISHLIGDEQYRAVSEGHFENGGVNWHPGDRGMKAIADALWTQLRPMLAE